MEEVNPYARLGVERDADAKAIKKAYVGLIRQFPPETHPEEFKAIRAAYELLSDPEARARYDEERRDYAELSEVEARALKVAEELLKSGKEEEVVKVYADLVQRQPTTTEGRLRLGSLLLQLGRPSEA
ncbi:MAG TPA: DnaJ domain-containing protein, partial [Myxococcota bacterium]|nr:DnaJ domain-containing protein [Myxococcota bacterium]